MEHKDLHILRVNFKLSLTLDTQKVKVWHLVYMVFTIDILIIVLGISSDVHMNIYFVHTTQLK